MNLKAPFVVLVASTSAGVGQTTLAQNLPVYLKGLAEELPVAYVSRDAAATARIFSLPGQEGKELVATTPGGSLADLLTLGEFGVEFASVGAALAGWENEELSRFLLAADYPGVLLFDLGADDPLLAMVLAAADLLLVPVKDPAALGEVVALRKRLLAAGGCAEQLWLVPSEVGDAGSYQAAAQSPDFFRFAAEERNFQVLDLKFCADLQVPPKATELGKPVLTRLPQSPLHFQLREMAEFILQQRQSDVTNRRRIFRLRRFRLLPERGGRVGLDCPLCGRPVLSGRAHYLESLPTRRRLLLHSACLERLLQKTAAADFLPTAAALLLLPAVFQGGTSGELKLLTLAGDGDLLESEAVDVAGQSGWADLFGAATGRCFEELYQDFLLLSSAQPVPQLLSSSWYRSFVILRRQLRAACREEKIV